MRIAVISDIHSNKAALDAVVSDLDGQRVDLVWVLGDLIGYGPNPTEVLGWVQENVRLEDWVLGNHEAFYASLLDSEELDGYSPDAVKTIVENRCQIDMVAEMADYAGKNFTAGRLKPVIQPVDGVDCCLIHASLRNHVLTYLYPWEKEILLPDEFEKQQKLSRARPFVEFCGHTHFPMFVTGRFVENAQVVIDWKPAFDGAVYELDLDAWQHFIINPGSVGQPRAGSTNPSYAVLDTGQMVVEFHCVEYEKLDTLRLLREEDYPDNVLNRLMWGSPPGTAPSNWKKYVTKSKEGMDD